MKDVGHQKMIDREYFNNKHPDIIANLQSVYDPEIPIDIYELGLIYDIQVNKDNSCDVTMTLTSPACPVAEQLPQWVQEAVQKAGHTPVRINLTFDPPWVIEFVSDDGRLLLGM